MFCGNREGAIAVLEGLAPEAKHMPVIGARRMVGDKQIVCTGDYGNASAGYFGSAVAGYKGNAIAGEGGKAEAGYAGTAEAGHAGSAIAGEGGSAVAGYRGGAIAGAYGSAVAGAHGKAEAGAWGNAVAGYRGSAEAGAFGTIQIKWWDEKANRYRITVGYIGEDGLKPNTPYQCDNQGKFVAVEKEGNGSSEDEFASLDSLPMGDLAKQSLQALRRYAALHLGIVGASKIPGGKTKLLEKIQEKRKG